MCIYSIKKLCKNFQVEDSNSMRKIQTNVLNNITLEVENNEMLCITGKSGCGKTTLLNILGGMLEPTEGEVFYQKNNIYKFSNKELEDYRRLCVGSIFQDYKLLDNISIKDNIILPLMLNHENVNTAIDKVEETAGYLEIKEKLDYYPYELSGGQKQRAAICRALMNDPNVILADEPTGNLDSESTMEVMKLLLDIKERLKKTIIIVTHDEEVANFCDRIIKIEQGHIF